MILATTHGGVEVEAQIKLIDDGFPRYEVRIEGVGYTRPGLRLFSLVSATPEERVRLALGGYDLPEAHPEARENDPR